MILVTELSNREEAPDFISDGQGVWRYSFGGDETYTDDQGALFFWSGRQQIFNIRGVSIASTNYTEVSSVALCQSNEQSFYWDDANQRLYVHHADDANDYTLSRSLYRILQVSAGFATGRFPGQISYYSDLYFDPRLINIGELRKEADPLKFGLLSFESSDYELANADGAEDDFSLADALNSQVRFVIMQAGQTDVDDGVRVFTGYTGGARRGDESLSVQLQEARTFYNRSVCPNVFDTTTYASLDSKYAGKPIPVAYGDIRRGIMVPVNTASFDKSAGGSVTFVLADPNLHDILSVDAVYDSDGNLIDGSPTLDPNNEVDISIPADADLDLGKFTWEGRGFDLTAGTYNNGLDIMRDVFANQAELAFLPTTFDTTEWTFQSTANTQPIGISVQSTRGLVEEIIEPITVSLQGIVDVLGDGRITFIPRDPNGGINKQIDQDQILEDPAIDIRSDEVVSEIVVEYSPNFVDRDDSLQTIYNDNAAAVGAAYGIARSDPISPVKTVLVNESDALAVGAEIASTSSDPQTIVSITIPLTTEQIQLFECIQVDIGRPRETDLRVFEVLGRGLRLQDGLLVLSLLLRELPDRVPVTFELRVTTSGVTRMTTDGQDREVVY